ncbi:hypothetical protein ABCR94_08435 [Streptomyces sp. 21So2-11]|uniref:hypothetical protein n=1 Tax=Streptomyces sp. 21So2-11 TaxID=3144408 RepID=UPI003219DAAF
MRQMDRAAAGCGSVLAAGPLLTVVSFGLGRSAHSRAAAVPVGAGARGAIRAPPSYVRRRNMSKPKTPIQAENGNPRSHQKV